MRTIFCALILVLLVACKDDSRMDYYDPDQKPNIVLIFADDLSWKDYGFMGNELVKTPNLDQLANDGVVFERGYVPTAICRPSLMTMATGLYPHEHRITGNDPSGGRFEPNFNRALLLESIDTLPTIPKILSENGYLSHQSGKWWEGSYQRGGFTHGMTQGHREGDIGLEIGRRTMQQVYDFIDLSMDKQKPFFMWFAPLMPHTPHNPPKEYLEYYKEIDIPSYQKNYYAMINWMDDKCGQLIHYIDSVGLRDNTIIYYLCDNGWIPKEKGHGFTNNSKRSANEGGVRTPIIWNWPCVLEPARRQDLFSSVDFFPTIMDIAGVPLDTSIKVSGINTWPNILRNEPIERTTVFGEGYGHLIVDKDDPEASLAYKWCIDGDWKLILAFDGKLEQWDHQLLQEMQEIPIRLYNLKEDPDELNNLYLEHPEIVERLTMKIEEWNPTRKRKLRSFSAAPNI